ncbi:MAG: 30S ribosomal protein S6 [Desulfobacterales bacterium]|jgi:small subunit ribosomal protein S6|nr:30S ribosomal protein S6 [Desulfobacterales bacterium]
MRRYETIYIANPNLDDEALKEIVTKFSDLIKKQKGSIVKIDAWGKRKMAYEVKRFDKGHYVLLDFCGLPEMVTELERNLKLDDRILKYSTVKIDEDVDPAELIGEEEKTEDSKENQVEEKQIESVEEA